jgi:uncharacterized protein YfbU (UPF0304 family)
MNLTDPEKLILIMLTEIYEHLKIKDGVDPKFVQSAIYSGNTWGLMWKYPGIFDGGSSEDPPLVGDVVDILEMWSLIEFHHGQLSAEDKALVKTEATPFGDAKFRGFDGNNDGSCIGIARFLIEHLDRFSEFKGRDLNSHYIDSTNGYNRMLAIFQPLRHSLVDNHLTVTQLISLLQAQRYPQ